MRDDDIVVILDDEHKYEDFVVEELVGAVKSGLDAASFYVYENRGVRVGQGADGFAMMGAAAQLMGEMVPLVMAHRSVRLHDDYWMSFVLQREGVTIHDLSPRLAARGARLSYCPAYETRGLVDEEGADSRPALNRDINRILFREARPTLSMRLARSPVYAGAPFVVGGGAGVHDELTRRWHRDDSELMAPNLASRYSGGGDDGVAHHAVALSVEPPPIDVGGAGGDGVADVCCVPGFALGLGVRVGGLPAAADVEFDVTDGAELEDGAGWCWFGQGDRAAVGGAAFRAGLALVERTCRVDGDVVPMPSIGGACCRR